MKSFAVAMGLSIVLALCSVASGEEGQVHLVLSGDWSGQAPDGSEISYSFSKDGSVIWRVTEKEFSKAFPDGLKAKYELRFGKPLCEIDIFDFNDPRFKPIRLRGILELTDTQTFKMEGLPSTKGNRPKEFGKEAIEFRAKKK